MKFRFIVILLLVSIKGFAQFGQGKQEDVQDIKKRTVILLLEEEDEKTVKKLSKNPQELKFYRDELVRVNQLLQEVSASFWTFTAAPVVKTRSEVEALKASKNKTHAVLAFDRYKATDWSKDAFGTTRYEGNSRIIAALFIDLIEEFEEKKSVSTQNLPNLTPTKGDLAAGLEMMQNYLNARLGGKKRKETSDEVKENVNLLKSKTLLLDKDDLKGKLSAADIKSNYPYAYKIVPYAEIEKAILEKDSQYAFVQIVPLSTGTLAFEHIVLDAGTGKALSQYLPIQVTTIGNKSNTAARIGDKALKAYVKNAE